MTSSLSGAFKLARTSQFLVQINDKSVVETSTSGRCDLDHPVFSVCQILSPGRALCFQLAIFLVPYTSVHYQNRVCKPVQQHWRVNNERGKLCASWILSDKLYVLNILPIHWKLGAYNADVSPLHEKPDHFFHDCIKLMYSKCKTGTTNLAFCSTITSYYFADGQLTRSNISYWKLSSNHGVFNI